MNTFNHLLLTALLAAPAASFAQTTDSITTAPTRNRCETVGRVVSDFSVYVGVNNFGGTLPAGYDFRPIGSRFVALAWQKRIPLAVRGTTKLRLITGPEITWNNFMFTDRNTLIERNNELIVEPVNVDLRKSKLVTTQLNLPLMLNAAFRSGLTVGVGAYAGVRLDSYTKVKPNGGRADRTHGSYNLNPVRWGLTTELGFRGSSKLFVRYELNSPFRAGQGPDTSVWAVGVKL